MTVVFGLLGVRYSSLGCVTAGSPDIGTTLGYFDTLMMVSVNS